MRSTMILLNGSCGRQGLGRLDRRQSLGCHVRNHVGGDGDCSLISVQRELAFEPQKSKNRRILASKEVAFGISKKVGLSKSYRIFPIGKTIRLLVSGAFFYFPSAFVCLSSALFRLPRRLGWVEALSEITGFSQIGTGYALRYAGVVVVAYPASVRY